MILREADLAYYLKRFCLRLEALERNREMLCLNLCYTLKSPQEIKMPEGTAVLSVRNGLEACFFLFTYKPGYVLVLSLLKLFRIYFACLKRASLISGFLRKLPTISYLNGIFLLISLYLLHIFII